MVENTSNIYFNFKLGMDKSECKTLPQKNLFNIFDFNHNGKIDKNELEISQYNFGDTGIKEKNIDKYLKALSKDSALKKNDNVPIIQYLNNLLSDEKAISDINFEDLNKMLSESNLIESGLHGFKVSQNGKINIFTTNIGDIVIEFNKNSLSIRNSMRYLSISKNNDVKFWLNEQNVTEKIDNPYYKGLNYNVEINGDNIKLTNKNTNEIIQIDLNKIVENLSSESACYIKFQLKQIPAEVLVDLFKEVSFVQDEKYFKRERFVAARYNHFYDNIAFNNIFRESNSFDKRLLTFNFIHELGHAMEYNESEGFSFSNNNDYRAVFESELCNYIKSGKVPYQYETKRRPEISDSEEFNYCTADIMEMFAECYTLLMLGDCYSKDCILHYFPKTLENVKNHIEYIRSLPQEVRHRK